MKQLRVFFLAGFTIIYTVLLSGFVFMKLWAWIVLYSFPNLPNVSLVGMIGLMMIWRGLHTEIKNEKKGEGGAIEGVEETHIFLSAITRETTLKLGLLLFAYIITLFQ